MTAVMIGIDPGLKGAIAFHRSGALTVHDLPLAQRRGKAEVDIAALSHLIADEVGRSSVEAVIEEVNAMPEQGAVSMFRFGMTYGALRGLLAGRHIAATLVRPTEWKKALRVSADKAEAISRASELLPESAPLWTVRRGHCTKEQASGRAEAALLALWGRRHLQADVEAMLR